MKLLHLCGSIVTAGVVLSGCHSNTNSENNRASYQITVKNLSYSQPMSPMAVAYHTKDTALFEVGKSSTLGLEQLAEGGDNSELLSELSLNPMVEVSTGGTGLILPGKSDTVTIEGEASECVSVVTMLVNTNDAFTGMNCVDVSTMESGEKMMLRMVTYDAGTEANSEEASTIPGPAGGGEGFNAVRDDRDFVSVHNGVVTMDDGLTTSALTQAHKWDNPAATLVIERIE